MIICHIITAFGFGGAEKLLTDLANIQAEKHKVHIIYFKGEPALQPILKKDIGFHHVPLGFSGASKLRSLLKLLKPDVVHTHLGHADLIGLWAARFLKVKRFCTMHNIWFKWNWTDKIIFRIYTFLFRTVAKDCSVIAISQSVAKHCREVLKVSPSKIHLLYNAIPNIKVSGNKEELREKLSIPTNSFCLLFIGRLEKQKSVDTLLRAANVLRHKIAGLRVIIVGDGRLREELQSLSKELGLTETVSFTGVKPNVDEYFSSADLFVLPSIFEGFGIVIIEAFRASLATIATGIEGPSEIIRDGVNGLLFKPLDHDALANAVMKLYESPELRKTIAQNGHQSYMNKFDIVSYAANMESIYSA